MTIKTLVFVLFLATAINSSQAKVSCSGVLGAKTNSSIVLPKELNTKPKIIARIEQNGHGDILLMISNLFTKYQDPHLINQLSFSFRRYNIDKGEENEAVNHQAFDYEWELLNPIFKHQIDQSQIKPMFRAIRANLEGSFLTDQEILVTVILMAQGKLDFRYKSNTRADRYVRSDRGEITQQERNTVKNFVTNTNHIRNWNRLIRDPGFRFFVEALLDSGLVDHHPRANIAKNLMSKTLNRSFQFKAGNQQTESIIGLLLTYVEDFIYNFSSFVEKNNEPDTVDRSLFLNILEEFLANALEDSSLVRVYLNFQDSFIFRTPFPVDHKRLAMSFIEGAKNILLPLKNEASKQLSRENQEAQNQEQALKTSPFAVTASATAFPYLNEENRRNRPNPRKRKNNSACGNTQNPSEALSSATSSEASQTATLCAETTILPDTAYAFYLLRNPEMPLQTITFSEDIVHKFNGQATVKWYEFIRPLLYGFTSEKGQNGIKKLGVNMNIKDIYEIKPGVSSYRIILKRKGNHWKAIAFLHKDDIPRYLNSF